MFVKKLFGVVGLTIRSAQPELEVLGPRFCDWMGLVRDTVTMGPTGLWPSHPLL